MIQRVLSELARHDFQRFTFPAYDSDVGVLFAEGESMAEEWIRLGGRGSNLWGMGVR